MGILISLLSSISTFYPEGNPGLQQKPGLYQEDTGVRTKQIYRIVGKLPTIAAYVYLHRIGRPMCSPGHNYGYVENFLYMMDRLSDESYRPNPLLVRVLDKLFILQADHELNTSTATMRLIFSSLSLVDKIVEELNKFLPFF
jgi:citrate synthase